METITQAQLVFIFIGLLWVLPWKGYAVWNAARLGHKRWFIVLIILNTFAILDIFYIFFVAKRTRGEIKGLFKTKI